MISHRITHSTSIFDWAFPSFPHKAIHSLHKQHQTGGQIQSDYECKPNHGNLLDCQMLSVAQDYAGHSAMGGTRMILDQIFLIIGQIELLMTSALRIFYILPVSVKRLLT